MHSSLPILCGPTISRISFPEASESDGRKVITLGRIQGLKVTDGYLTVTYKEWLGSKAKEIIETYTFSTDSTEAEVDTIWDYVASSRMLRNSLEWGTMGATVEWEDFAKEALVVATYFSGRESRAEAEAEAAREKETQDFAERVAEIVVRKLQEAKL